MQLYLQRAPRPQVERSLFVLLISVTSLNYLDRNKKKNQIGKLIGPSRGFGFGFGVLYDTTKDVSPANNGQIYGGGYFKTHFFIDPKEELIGIVMTQKVPSNEDYIIAITQAVYGAID